MIPLGVLASRRPAAAGGAWTPAELTDLTYWFDASDAATITHDAGAVSQWADKSGNGYHLTQAGPTARPTTGTHTRNGLNVLHFDGGDDLRVLTPAITTSASTYYAVASRVTDGRWLSISPNLGYIQIGFGFWFGGTVGPSISPAASASTWYTLGVQAAGASSWMRRNGSQVAAGNIGPNTSVQDLCIGSRFGSFYLTGQIAEVVVVAAALSAGDRAALESYLMTKWSTP